MPRMSDKQAGFTLVEIAVIAPIVLLAIIGILALLINLMGNNLAARTEVAIVHDTNAALNTIEDDIRITSAFIPGKDTDFSDPYGSNGSGAAWDYKGSSATSRVLILRAYATTRSPRDSQKQPVYINESGCGANIILSNPALTTNIIYFLQNGSLYRRTLTRTGPSTCAPQFQRQSCPPNLASPNTICKATDALLVSGVTNFSPSYFASAETPNAIDVYNTTDPNALNAAKTVDVKLEVERRINGKPFKLTRNLRVTKLN